MYHFPAEAKTVKDQVYGILKSEILQGSLSPGEKLIEQNLADRLMVSRSPVREAIKQLTGDGLVVNPPNKGAYVKKLSPREFADLYELRVMYELYAAGQIRHDLSLAGRTALAMLRSELTDAAGRQDIKHYFTLDFLLHSRVVELAGNALMTERYHTLSVLLRAYIFDASGDRPIAGENLRDHQMMIDAILRGDNDGLQGILAKHLQRVKDQLLQEQDAEKPQASD